MNKKIRILLYIIFTLIVSFLVLSNFVYSQTSFQIEKVYSEEDLFNTGKKIKIAKYKEVRSNEKEEEEIELDDDDKDTLILGLFDLKDELITNIFQIDYYNTPTHKIKFHSLELKDLNKDGLKDIILNIRESGKGFFNAITSTFLINTKDSFKEIKKTFNKEQYEFAAENVIKLTTPLHAYGNPDEDFSNPDKNLTWRDYYIFQNDELIKINHRYPKYYSRVKANAQNKMNEWLEKVKNYRIDIRNPGASQFQLNEYYHQITSQKIIIERCREILRDN